MSKGITSLSLKIRLLTILAATVTIGYTALGGPNQLSLVLLFCMWLCCFAFLFFSREVGWEVFRVEMTVLALIATMFVSIELLGLLAIFLHLSSFVPLQRDQPYSFCYNSFDLTDRNCYIAALPVGLVIIVFLSSVYILAFIFFCTVRKVRRNT